MKQALVLGVNGGIGSEVARSLLAHGWRVRALVRDPSRVQLAGVALAQGDAMRPDDVLAAASGADLIVHAVNPPGYRDWDKLVLPMLDNTIAAAKAAGARILLPGTLYNYGSGTAQPITETTVQRPSSRKGAIRVQMEQRLQKAAAQGVRALVVRAGDFFGPHCGNSWFAQGMIRPGQPVRAVALPGDPGVGHAWAYLPDLAETMVRLAERDAQLAPYDVFHFRGHWDGDGRQLAEAVRAVAGEQVTIKAVPWLLLRLAAPFVTVLREMMEMRYLWREAFELENAKLVALLGDEPHTPLDTAMRATLAGLGCLPEPAPAYAA